MLPPLIGAADLPPRSRSTRPDHRVAGVLLAVALLATGAAVHHAGSAAVGTARRAATAVPETPTPEQATPGIDLPSPGRIPLGSPVPVRTGRFAPTDLRCRAWTADSVSVAGARRYPVAARPDGGAHCEVVLAPPDMAPGGGFTVQLIRVDEAATVVGEYRPVVLRWSDPHPRGD
jgi:hypothetical protein